MSPTTARRIAYLVALAVLLVLWVAVGDFTAVESPYVGFWVVGARRHLRVSADHGSRTAASRARRWLRSASFPHSSSAAR